MEWKQENDGASALLVEGARRVGKSTIVELFARNEYESYILIDFNKASKAIKSLFDDIKYLCQDGQVRMVPAYITPII